MVAHIEDGGEGSKKRKKGKKKEKRGTFVLFSYSPAFLDGIPMEYREKKRGGRKGKGKKKREGSQLSFP